MKKKLLEPVKSKIKNLFLLNKKIKMLNKVDVDFIKKNYLNKDEFYIIIKNFGKTSRLIDTNTKYFIKVFGKILKQDKSGIKIKEIKPNLKKLQNQKYNKNNVKLRYHETNTGGFIHTDGPQLNNPPKYLFMACKKNAERGGHTYLSSIEKVLVDLKKNDQKTLSMLKKNFLFERRGFYKENQKKIHEKPIIKFYNKSARFRYLRDYINEAYKIKSIKLSKIQIKSLDKLDKLLLSKKNHYKFKLDEGDAIILNNFKLAHGRSAFSLGSSSNRSLTRVWFK